MREIKFRAWDLKNKKMIQWWDGQSDDSETNLIHWKFFSATHPYFNLELMQYTGLKDKNGKEIYEGDIVKYKYVQGFEAETEDNKVDPNQITEMINEVKFKDGEFWPRPDKYIPEDCFYGYKLFDFEIIGNIYQNPELLK